MVFRMTEQRRIVVHGYGTYAIVYRNMIAFAKNAMPDVEWAMILPTSHHLAFVREVMDADRVLCLADEQRIVSAGQPDMAVLAGYRGNLYADIEAEKKVYKHRPAAQQLERAVEIYQIYLAFLKRVNPTHILLSHVETFDGKVLISLADELGIPAMSPTDLRTLGGTVFTDGSEEALPQYRIANEAYVVQAKKFLVEFRASPKPSWNPGIFTPAGDEPMPRNEKGLPRRTWEFVTRTARNPRLFEPALFTTSLKYAFPGIREAIRSVRAVFNGRKYDFAAMADMPAKYIYYPLQTTPESSINTPAPYYVDQMRAIDAIRFAMPSDHTLVVKEHWASIGIRPTSFYKVLRRKAGVQIAHFSVSSIELIKNAQLTISVTGTATFEAFLLGRSSLVLGGCFIASYLGGICPIGDLPARIRQAIDNPPSDDYILKALTEIYDVRHECVVRSADEPGFYGNRPENIRRVLYALLDHMKRLREFAQTGRNEKEVFVKSSESGGFVRTDH
jgi:hypothetical protein